MKISPRSKHQVWNYFRVLNTTAPQKLNTRKENDTKILPFRKLAQIRLLRAGSYQTRLQKQLFLNFSLKTFFENEREISFGNSLYNIHVQDHARSRTQCHMRTFRFLLSPTRYRTFDGRTSSHRRLSFSVWGLIYRFQRRRKQFEVQVSSV